MKNKGFTLVELLAVIVILGLLVTITVPNIMNAINFSREKSYDRQIELIEEATARWAVDNMRLVSTKESITVEELKQEGYLNKNETLKNPKTKKEMNGCVFINKEGSKYIYEYSESCTR